MKTINAPGFRLQDTPPIFCTSLKGRWLLEQCDPSWRAKDPKKGFQRMVKEPRARQIAVAVLDQRRTFPNAIILATDASPFKEDAGELVIPARTRFLVIDGQHRLWAQNYSDFEAPYACLIHTGLAEKDMAKLFLEINDTQRRVPSSLRWDLLRLVRPDTKQQELTVKVADIIYELTTRSESPFFEDIDLTGESRELSIRQGSLAPEMAKVLSRDQKRRATLEEYVELFIRFFSAIRALDPDGWGDPAASRFYRARVLRALLRVLADIVANWKPPLDKLTAATLQQQFGRIDPDTLSSDRIRAAQGTAGVKDLYDAMRAQVLKSAK